MVSMFQGRSNFCFAEFCVVQVKTRKQQHTEMKLIDKSVNILSELVMNMIKSNRQLQYDSHRSNDRA